MIGCFTSSYYSWNLLRREYRIYKKCIVILDKNFLESRENDEEPNLQIIRHVLDSRSPNPVLSYNVKVQKKKYHKIYYNF